MLSAKNNIYYEIQSFLNEISKGRLIVVNSRFMTKQPAQENRIEYKLVNFRNLSHNYEESDKSGDNYKLGVNATYKANLIIRVISYPDETDTIMGEISNALQIFEYRDMFMPSLSILNHTLRQMIVPVEKNGTIFNLGQINLEVNMVLPYNVDIDYFVNIENAEVIIKE